MATQPVYDDPVSIEEYLSTVYESDCEFVDGAVIERNGGEFNHSFMTAIAGAHLFSQCAESGLIALISVRVQTGPTRIRVPDLAVIRAGSSRERTISHPPLLTVEIQAPDDSIRQLEVKALEYLALGVEYVWVIDPQARVAYRGTPKGLELVRDGELSVSGTPIRISAQGLFAELDRV